MEKKINYYLESLKEIERIKGRKPKLLLHACCGPCLTFPIKFLTQYFDVTVFFNNSNIYPEEEYYRRKDEMIKFLEYFYHDYGIKVKVIETPYDNENYNKPLEKYKDMDEGKERCFMCYEKRMGEAYDYAEKNGFDYFTTVMTISRQKNSQIINDIGKKLSLKHPNTKYFYSDFKKNKGIDYAREMRIQYNLYQQLYCGCKFTYEKLLKKQENQ
ncbi:MAG: epoxyqueuosine reductase QueH [Erysipelotrichaceae bacterium]|nr:epoxyqueuosine reductase QueH [Erysipelotrichaceae bacterium]